MQHGHAKDKHILPQWKNESKEVLTRLLVGLIASDGNEETLTYTTASEKLANDVQEISFKAGMASIVRKVTNTIDSREFTAYRIRLCNKHMKPKMPPITHKIVPYEDNVYCVTVPNHVFFCRRNGKASWTGNCGYLTIEITNTSSWPVDLFIGQGIAQLQFHVLSSDPEVSYADKGGIYQDQTGVTASRIR
jgi:dCTP deaminase